MRTRNDYRSYLLAENGIKTAPLAKSTKTQTLEAFCCGQSFVYQVWLSSGPPEFFTFSSCARMIVKLASTKSFI